MCGILGLWSFQKKRYSTHHFERFVNSLSHRGPDGSGVHEDQNACLKLGHTRLAILDLSNHGAQPMACPHRRYFITYNGEIYNFLELKDELEKLGHHFQTRTDTEVILASYIEWGKDCQYKFNGMWAFAIWDSKTKTLFLSRDRFGIKPLYYHHSKQKMAFASELKAFLALDDLAIDFDECMVAKTLQDGNSLETDEKTLLNGIRNLQAGHFAIVNHLFELKIQKWWNTENHLVDIPEDPDAQIMQLRELFIDACRIRMRSDIPLGSALSGGLDSSSIVSTIATIRKNPCKLNKRIPLGSHTSFCASYPGTSQDEALFAKTLTTYHKLPCHFIPIDQKHLVSQIENCIFDLETISDLPIGPWSIYKEFRKKNITVSIDGHGADELFGGYHHHVELAMEESLLSKPNLKRFSELEKMLQTIYPENSPVTIPGKCTLVTNAIKRNLKTYPRTFLLLKSMRKLHGRIKGNKTHLHFLNAKPAANIQLPKTHFKGLNKHLYYDFHYRTLPTILRNFDRSSMAHGIEIRSPFLDYRIVNFAFSLQMSQAKIANGYTKNILREAMQGIVPDEIRLRKTKVGFANPTVEWFKKDLKPFILDQISSRSFLDSSIWNGRNIHDYVLSCYKRNDFVNARKCWEYIQANLLIKQFKRHSE